MSATPRPWTTGSDDNVYSRCGNLVARVMPTCDVGDTPCSGDAPANAEMIVHRVNCHGQLVEALKAWETWEAKLITDCYPNGAVEHMSAELLAETTRVQKIRNAAIEAGEK